MTKKQLKKLAKDLANLEIIIQRNEDVASVEEAKNKMMKLTNSADLELEEMLELDVMIQELIKQKLAS